MPTPTRKPAGRIPRAGPLRRRRPARPRCSHFRSGLSADIAHDGSTLAEEAGSSSLPPRLCTACPRIPVAVNVRIVIYARLDNLYRVDSQGVPCQDERPNGSALLLTVKSLK